VMFCHLLCIVSMLWIIWLPSIKIGGIYTGHHYEPGSG
jgi:hypothetical protein